MEKKIRKIVKREGGKIENGRRKSYEMKTFFFFFFFCLSLFKPLKFVLGLPKWKLSTWKKHFTPGKKSGKMTLPLQKSFPVTPLVCSTWFGPLISNGGKLPKTRISLSRQKDIRV